MQKKPKKPKQKVRLPNQKRKYNDARCGLRKSATSVLSDHKEGRKAHLGSDLRLELKVRRAAQLHLRGYYYWEIAEAVAKEFEMKAPPAKQTIAEWITKAHTEVIGDIKLARGEFIKKAFLQLEEAKRPILKFLYETEIEIQRENREDFHYFDENHISERVKMTAALVKIVDSQAKLLGVNKDEEQEGDGPKTETELQSWLIGYLTGANDPLAQLKTIKGEVVIPAEAEASRLELRAGIEEADSLNDLGADTV